jgi:hypothetical protein
MANHETRQNRRVAERIFSWIWIDCRSFLVPQPRCCACHRIRFRRAGGRQPGFAPMPLRLRPRERHRRDAPFEIEGVLGAAHALRLALRREAHRHEDAAALRSMPATSEGFRGRRVPVEAWRDRGTVSTRLERLGFCQMARPKNGDCASGRGERGMSSRPTWARGFETQPYRGPFGPSSCRTPRGRVDAGVVRRLLREACSCRGLARTRHCASPAEAARFLPDGPA